MITSLLAGGILSLLWSPAAVVGAGVATGLALVNGVSIPVGITLLIGFLTLIFSLQYFDGNERRKFMAMISLSIVGMILFLQASDWLYLYFSWELMGLCSYVLISMKSTEVARRAARKAFIIGRISSVAFLAAFGLIYVQTGTLDFTVIPAAAAVLLLISAMAKSSQFPFLWLNDAMNAPTPVSALLHSSTMVAAGPLLLHRFAPYFTFLTPHIQTWATVSLLIASVLAIAQNNIKKMLGFSTIATLAFLYMIFDSPALPLAFATHALLKAGLFILVGTYAKGFSYSTEIGLEKNSFSSYLTLFFIVSLAGVPPFGLFWRKLGEGPLALVTLFISLIYLLRMHSSVFSGGIRPPRGLGTIVALALAIISISTSIDFLIPNLRTVVEFLIVSFVAVKVHKLGIWGILGTRVSRLFSHELPGLIASEELLEKWGYSAGKSINQISERFRGILTGPVTRDIAYIAVSLAALALGVVIC